MCHYLLFIHSVSKYCVPGICQIVDEIHCWRYSDEQNKYVPSSMVLIDEYSNSA